MRIWLASGLTMIGLAGSLAAAPSDSAAARPGPSPSPQRKVCIIPVREQVASPLLYLVRRGVKEAINQEANLIVLDMKTPGGEVSTTREIIDSLNQFSGETVTFVNRDAFSAGVFIAVATRQIYMAPGSVIGAAAPVVPSPTGDGVMAMPDTYEKKITSAVRALVRASAEKNGHNLAVVDAMIDKTRGLTIDGKVIAREGELLTLTNTEAEKEYGNPPRRLLSAGTVADLDELLRRLGYQDAIRLQIEPTGMERIGAWLTAISPLLLIIGGIGLFIEFKTPGFGLPGIIGIAAFILFFLGGHAAGLSGLEWIVVFVLGLALIAIELFVYPGTIALGIIGAALTIAAVIMAMVDLYPHPGRGFGLPSLPNPRALQLPLLQMVIAMMGTALGAWMVSRYLPKTSLYRSIVSMSASGVQSEARQEEQRSIHLGQEGVALSTLRPGGKAQFGEEILDVMSQGDMVSKGTPVRIIGYSGTEAVVEVINS
jgi:membrane-bound serine protease (ClpP class)